MRGLWITSGCYLVGALANGLAVAEAAGSRWGLVAWTAWVAVALLACMLMAAWDASH